MFFVPNNITTMILLLRRLASGEIRSVHYSAQCSQLYYCTKPSGMKYSNKFYEGMNCEAADQKSIVKDTFKKNPSL